MQAKIKANKLQKDGESGGGAKQKERARKRKGGGGGGARGGGGGAGGGGGGGGLWWLQGGLAEAFPVPSKGTPSVSDGHLKSSDAKLWKAG